MNAMNFVFVPNGLTATTLEDHFDHCYRAFYSRPDVLWGLARLLVREPRFIAQLGSSARVYVRSKFAEGRYVIGRLSRRPPRRQRCPAADRSAASAHPPPRRRRHPRARGTAKPRY